jgi:hypothetical protein
MKLLNCLKNNRMLFAILFAAVFARLVYFFDWHEIWWDSGVYFGMAKYLWSGGASGLWEPIRPVLWPLILGAGWAVNLNIVWFARILEFLLSIVSIILVYAIARKIFSQRAAVVSSAVWAFSSIVFYMGFHEYTEIPEVTLVLAAVLAFVSGRNFAAGIFAGLAFTMKFPAGIFLAVLGLCLILQKRWKPAVNLGIGFAIPAISFLVFNQAMYGSMLKPIIEAHKSILLVVGCNILRYKPWYQYFGWILFDNVLNLFALLGIAVAVRNWKKQYFLPLLSLLLPLAYFSQLHCRDYRYLVLFLPFVILFTGYGIDRLISALEEYKKISKYVLPIALIIVFAVSAVHGILFYQHNELRNPDLAAERYYNWLETRQVEGEIWSSNPVIAAYTDQKINKIYYPVYGQETATDFNKYLEANSERVGAVLLDNCGGGLICSPDDEKCPVELEKMRVLLNERFRQVFFDESGRCWYSIYSR